MADLPDNVKNTTHPFQVPSDCGSPGTNRAHMLRRGKRHTRAGGRGCNKRPDGTCPPLASRKPVARFTCTEHRQCAQRGLRRGPGWPRAFKVDSES